MIADIGHVNTVSAIAEKLEARDFRLGAVGVDGMQRVRLLGVNHVCAPDIYNLA